MTSPVIIEREVTLSFRLASKANEVFAHYPDRIVLLRAKYDKPLPADVHEADGAERLLSLSAHGRPLQATWNEVDSVAVHHVVLFHAQTTITLKTVGFDKKLAYSPEVAAPVVDVLRARLGGRFIETRDSKTISWLKVWRSVALICVAIALLEWGAQWLLWRIHHKGKPFGGRVRVLWAIMRYLHDTLGMAKASFLIGALILGWGFFRIRGVWRDGAQKIAEGYPDPFAEE